MTAATPAIGDWYRDGDGPIFEIVSVDDDEWFIEVQYFDGTIEELDGDEWDEGCRKGEIVKVDPPEGWE